MSVVSLLVTDFRKFWRGTGFVAQFIEGTCLIMTNYHVVKGASRIHVLLPPNGQRFVGGYVQKGDLASDLAIVRLNNVAGEFRPMVFAEFVSLTSFVQPVYLHAYFRTSDLLPARSPGQIIGMVEENNVLFFHGTFASHPGTSGGPVTMGGKVVAVNCAVAGGSRRCISLLAVYNTLMVWCGFEDGNYTIDEMLRRLI